MLTEQEINENKEKIITLLRSTEREGMESVIEYLNSHGFFTVPSSLHRHHNWRGGLAQHCLGVCMRALDNAKGQPKESVIIAGLLHDICKASKLYYDEGGNLHHHHTHIHGHGYRSIKLLEICGLKLTEDERRAIRWHMGGHHASADQLNSVSEARKSLLWQVIHKADKMDAAANGINKIN